MKIARKQVVLVGILLAIVGGATFLYVSNQNKNDNAQTTQSPINAPTAEEQMAGDKVKEEIVDDSTYDQDQPPASTNVNITNASVFNNEVDVNAYTNHYESGICTFSFTKDGQSAVVTQTDATKDVSTTICANPLLSTSKFPVGGNWVLTVQYKNTAGSVSGTSSEQAIDITKE